MSTDVCRDDAGGSAFDGFIAEAVDGFGSFSAFCVFAGAAGCLSGFDDFEVFTTVAGTAAVVVGAASMMMTVGVSGRGADRRPTVFRVGDDVGPGGGSRLGSSINGVVE